MQKDSIESPIDRTVKRSQNVQILRFVAAAMVLCTHITFYIHERIDKTFSVWEAGGAGVPIFFAISGYIMFVTTARSGSKSQSPWSFLKRRIARVLPLYWLLTTLKIGIALLMPALVLHNHPGLLSSIGSYLLIPMLDNRGQIFLVHGVGWTLLHEMFFYYLFAFALALRVSPLSFCASVIVLLSLVGNFTGNSSALEQVVCNKINLMFVIGMATASWLKQPSGSEGFKSAGFFWFACAVFLTTILGEGLSAAFGAFSITIVLIAAFLCFLQIPIFRTLRSVLAGLGNSSYSLYMIHPIVAAGACVALQKTNFFSVYWILVLAVLISLGVAELVYRFIELPLNRIALEKLDQVFK
jgi:exopolysaccharide production protein ExoZ